MRTLTEKYNGVLKGLFSKDQFLRDARMEQSQLITQHNSYQDAVNILTRKGLISEGELNKYGKFAKAKSEAMKLSKEEGKKKYVEQGPDETFIVSNSYDDKKTIASFENGKFLSGKETLDESGTVGEGMTPEEWADAKEQERLQAHPERKGIEDVRAMLDKERFKPMKFDDPKLDQEYQEWLATTDYDGPLEEQGEESLEEGPAKNNPKIERLVAGINDLISKAVDDVGDPIGVIEPGTTWEEPYMYYPIEYKNGQLKITSQSLYKNTPEVYTILARNMEYDGIPTLRLIMRMYKKALKKAQIQEETNIKYMDSANTLLQALKPTFHNAEIVFAGRNNDLARVTYHTENPGGEGITTVNCGETSISSLKPFFHQEVDETGDTNTVSFNTIEELIQYCKSGEEMFEKKLTPAEKKGKEKIVKGLEKTMGKTPMAYAIATARAKELYEGPAEVDTAYYDIIAKVAEHAKSLNDDDAYQFHEQLKSFFNRMLENVNEESSSKVKKGDILKHKSSGIEVKVTAVSHKESGEPRLYRGVIVDTGKITGLDPIDKTYQIRPTLVGTTWSVKEQISEGTEEIEEQDIHLAKQIARAMSREDGVTKYVVEREKMVITYAVVDQPEAGNTIAAYENGAPIAGLNEAKDKYTEIESPKPELPLDVLHHGIRFELDKKKKSEKAPSVYRPTEEEYMKAFKAATKNLEKDLLYYKKEEGATEAPVSKKEEMVKMKLKENFKTIIRNILSEDTSSKKSFNIKGEVL